MVMMNIKRIISNDAYNEDEKKKDNQRGAESQVTHTTVSYTHLDVYKRQALHQFLSLMEVNILIVYY